MDTEFNTHLTTIPSSFSTTTDHSQDFSPPKLKHRDSINYSCNSTQASNQGCHEDSDNDSFKADKKPIFTVIRDPKFCQNLNVPLNKDFGNYNRKEKSLGELSKRLLIMFGRVDQCIISLDTVTQQLGVERRRIYDIINILESLGVVYRKGKNSYQWKGLKSIYETIKKLQRDSIHFDENHQDLDFDEEDDPNCKSLAKREKSLGLLSTGFIKLFISWKGTISLEQAGRKLSSENVEENKIKTKIRRLYDIANVFSSLGLIKKTCLESKKPAYQWVGLPGLDAFIKRLNSSSDEKEIFQETSTRHKEKVNPILEKKITERQQHSPSNIQSNNSAFKSHETIPLINPNVVENILSTLLNLYTKQMLTPKIPLDNANLSEKVFKQSPLEKFTTQQLPSLGVSDRSRVGFVSPSLKKSVPIIQKTDMDDGLSERKGPSGLNGFTLHDKSSSGLSSFKRRPIQNLNDFEMKTLKKLNSCSEIGNSASTKPLSFQ